MICRYSLNHILFIIEHKRHFDISWQILAQLELDDSNTSAGQHHYKNKEERDHKSASLIWVCKGTSICLLVCGNLFINLGGKY